MTLEYALKAAIKAARDAEREGQRIGYSVRFTATDIRILALGFLDWMRSNA